MPHILIMSTHMAAITEVATAFLLEFLTGESAAGGGGVGFTLPLPNHTTIGDKCHKNWEDNKG
jgi:hypothetical protein